VFIRSGGPLTYVPEGKTQKLVEECVRSIDWALRDVLPGKSHEQFVVTPADSLEEVAKNQAESSSSETKTFPAGTYKPSGQAILQPMALYLEKPK